MGTLRLTGRRVVVTRPRERAAPLVAALRAEGAEVIALPMIEVVPPEDRVPLERAAARLEQYDRVVFTSAYAVWALRAAAGPVDPEGPPRPDRPRFACVGEATAEAAEAAGWAPDLVPETASAAALVAAIRGRAAIAGARILFPRASDAGPAVPVALRAAGAVVEAVVAYRKITPRALPERELARVRGNGADAVIFTSPSTVRNFKRLVGVPGSGTRVVVIGETTAGAAEAAGLRVAAVAEAATVGGLVEGVIRAFNG